MLAFQRSRLASNIFGARIDLKKPIALGPSGKVVHVLINRPMEGRVMLVGLGKRRDRAGQSQEVFGTFWHPLPTRVSLHEYHAQELEEEKHQFPSSRTQDYM